MDEHKLWTGEKTFVQMMIAAYDKYGDKCTDFYYCTCTHALDLLITGGIIVINGKMVKETSRKPVKLYNPETREVE